MSSKIDLFLNETYLSHGITKWVPWDMEQAPMALCVGQSGSGKSYCCNYLLAKLYLATQCELYYLDYKGDIDNDYLVGAKRFYRYSECHEGLTAVYDRFIQRQNGTDHTRHVIAIFWDEYSSYCNAGDKKIIEEDKKKLGILVSMGRSFKVHCIIAQQTGHASYFNQFRDNFSLCIGMGNLSDEGRKMLFPDFAKDLPPNRSRGTGFLSFNGLKPLPFVVPKIRNRLLVQDAIRKAVDTPIR